MKPGKVFRILAFSILILLLLLSLPAGVALAASVSLSASSGIVGSTLAISGIGFTANTSGTVTFGSGTIFVTSYSVASDNTGALNTSITVPSVPGTTYTIQSIIGSASASNYFLVTPSIVLSTTSAHVGDQVTVSGTGFSASLTETITFDDATVITANTNEYGSFSVVLNVPHSFYGTHTVRASDAYVYNSTTFSTLPLITASPASGGVGSNLTIIGTGFRNSTSVTVNLDGTAITTATSASNGDFSISFAVPSISGGTHSISATDGTASASTIFNLLSALRLSAASGVVGASITVNGSAFNNSAQLTLLMDNNQLTQSTTNANGTFSVSLTVPASPGGAHTITATDGSFSASATFTITSTIKVNPATGKVGSKASVSGTGFGSARSVSVSFDNVVVPPSVAADANGSFNAVIDVPASSAGSHPVSAGDGTFTAGSNFTTVSNMSASPDRGPMGSPVTVTGTGFLSGSPVSIQIGSVTVKNTTADAKGGFSEKVAVPPQLNAAEYNLTVSDGTNSLTTPFTITSSFNISQATGNVGSNVTASGTGFSGGVTVKYDDSTVATPTAIGGSFSSIFAVPVSIHGPHIISVADTATSLQLTFTMESNPPPKPTVLEPLDGVRQNKQPTLTWEPVIDPSGVNYTLQIATDDSFANIVLEKTGFTESRYALTSAEKLNTVSKNAPYYWRVKAIDLAQNESDWSSPGSFFVTLLPPLVFSTLIAAGALVVILLVFLIVRKTRSNF